MDENLPGIEIRTPLGVKTSTEASGTSNSCVLTPVIANRRHTNVNILETSLGMTVKRAEKTCYIILPCRINF